MAVTITLNLGGVEGASNFDNQEKENFKNINKVKGKGGQAIDVLSWSWGLTQHGSAHVATGAGSGTADVSDLTFTKYVDKTSPLLVNNCFKGINHGGAILTCWKVGGAEKIPYLQIKMGDIQSCDKTKGIVFISSVQSGAQGADDQLMETVSFNFNKVEVVYICQKDDGTAGDTMQYGTLNITAK